MTNNPPETPNNPPVSFPSPSPPAPARPAHGPPGASAPCSGALRGLRSRPCVIVQGGVWRVGANQPIGGGVEIL
ncbi:hypothetical protein [Roseiflexus castenholzii]|uniref:hypothetical protein n=1 Tax=Roseiflexus castenholzii TaxID=120962 RepID=UPI003C7D7E8F